MTSSISHCKVHAGLLRRCGNPPVEGLEICQPCLDILLNEPDPQRRRALAATGNLPRSLVERLAGDPDEHIRALVAARSDLPPTLAQQFASNTESSPLVSRALAGSSNALLNAGDLISTGDPLTLATLAAHPDLDGELLDQLTDHPDLDVSTSAIATRAGLRPDPAISRRVTEAARTDMRPIASPQKGTPMPVSHFRRKASPAPPAVLDLEPAPIVEALSDPPVEVELAAGDQRAVDAVLISATPVENFEPRASGVHESVVPPLPALASLAVVPDPLESLDDSPTIDVESVIGDLQELTSDAPSGFATDTDPAASGSPSEGSRSRRAFAFVGAAVVLVAITAGITQLQHDPRPTPSATPLPTIQHVATTTTALASSTTSATTNPPSTQPPAPPTTVAVGPTPTAPPLPSPVPPQPAVPAPIEAPPAPSGPVTRSIQVTSTSGRFCGSVRVTANFSPSPASVTVTDDQGHQVGAWSGLSGQTRAFELSRATNALTVKVQANGTGLAVSASASGDSC